eukprot:TRINITY_DN1745_c0_g1_i1.p1 TRINITY_DN1745_c0_g1~~TRINITY_DN1745_c0_g1_i1.p1  ORF type:complete len:176 (+),score=22.31 TRINITY_DN1745_c0_g1_i1:48-530(+)
MILRSTSRTGALGQQRRGFLHFFLFRKKVLSPIALNPWREIPEWQQYLRRKAVENPKYHQYFYDEVNPELQRQGMKAQLFVFVAIASFITCYWLVLTIRSRSLQIDAEEIQNRYLELNKKLTAADNLFISRITDTLTEVANEKSDRQRGKKFKEAFTGLI